MAACDDTGELFAGLNYDEALQRVLADPATHEALRRRILEDAQRDPVDSLNDAEVLYAVQQLRLEAVLASADGNEQG